MPKLTTKMGPYKTLNTLADASAAVDTDLAAASGYTIAVPSGAVDLLESHGAGKDTEANGVSIILHATGAANGDTLTQKIYGYADKGPAQLIASVVWTIGTARVVAATATHLWADDAAITSSHIATITEADGGGSDRVCSIEFDVTGYRYLYGLITAQTGGPTLVTSLYRHW